jgi:hypothetical protein
MFLRKKKNKSGSISVQIISKSGRKYRVVKSIDSGKSEQEIQKLCFLGKQEIKRLSFQPKILISESDTIVENIFETLNNASISKRQYITYSNNKLFLLALLKKQWKQTLSLKHE